MKEIKFACPRCAQHIACDPDYADTCIDCPGCGQKMEVPRLSASEGSPSGMCIVASTPRPQPRVLSRIPTIDLWTERDWDDHFREGANKPQQTPAWIISALGTLICAAVLKAELVPDWAVWLCVAAGTVLSCILFAKKRTIASPAPEYGSVMIVLLRIGLLLIAIPVVALGILFLGCTACR